MTLTQPDPDHLILDHATWVRSGLAAAGLVLAIGLWAFASPLLLGLDLMIGVFSVFALFWRTERTRVVFDRIDNSITIRTQTYQRARVTTFRLTQLYMVQPEHFTSVFSKEACRMTLLLKDGTRHRLTRFGASPVLAIRFSRQINEWRGFIPGQEDGVFLAPTPGTP